MRGVRFTAAERNTIDKALTCLQDYLSALETSGALTKADDKAISTIRTKLSDSDKPSTNVPILPLERLLVMACSKCISLDNAQGYARASILAGKMDITDADMIAVGHWMQRQGWITSKMTILDVLSKWPSWRAKALAEANNVRPKPGLGDNNNGANTKQEPKSNTNRPRQGFAC